MLVLSRKVGETIYIDGQIKVTIVRVSGNSVRIGIEAPDTMNIVRSELVEWDDFSFDDTHQRRIPPAKPLRRAINSGRAKNGKSLSAACELVPQ